MLLWLLLLSGAVVGAVAVAVAGAVVGAIIGAVVGAVAVAAVWWLLRAVATCSTSDICFRNSSCINCITPPCHRVSAL